MTVASARILRHKGVPYLSTIHTLASSRPRHSLLLCSTIMGIALLALMFTGCNMFESNQTEISKDSPRTPDVPGVDLQPGQPLKEQKPVRYQTAAPEVVSIGGAQQPSGARDLTSQQATELERAIEDAGQLVSTINDCAKEQGNSPPSPGTRLEEQHIWYADAVFRYRHCIASKITGVSFEENSR